MKVGLIITTYNRPEYLKRCLESLEKAVFPENFVILFVDDGSTDSSTLVLIESFVVPVEIHKKFLPKNKGIHNSLLIGFNYLFGRECDLVMNLDADAIVKPDFVEKLLSVHSLSKGIVSGFNTLTCDPTTKRSRHPILSYHNGYVRKRSIGGINMLMDEPTFRRFLEAELQKGYNWDWRVCAKMQAAKAYFAVGIPSCIDHIGFDSTFDKHLNPDVAEDFNIQ